MGFLVGTKLDMFAGKVSRNAGGLTGDEASEGLGWVLRSFAGTGGSGTAAPSSRMWEPPVVVPQTRTPPHTPGRRMLAARPVRALERGWHAAVGWFILPQAAPAESVLIPAMKNTSPAPRIIIYYYCSVLAESALTALQYFPFAEEFPLLSLRVITPNHSEQQQSADFKLWDP